MKHSFAGYRILGCLSALRICHPTKGYGRLHKPACRPYTAAVILFSVSFWFYYTCCQSSHSASLQTTRGMRETGGKNPLPLSLYKSCLCHFWPNLWIMLCRIQHLSKETNDFYFLSRDFSMYLAILVSAFLKKLQPLLELLQFSISSCTEPLN